MTKFKNSLFSKCTSFVTILAFLSIMIGPSFAKAASLTTITDTMSRQTLSTASTNVIKFTTPTAINDSGGTNNIVIAFPSGFDFTGSVIGDLTFTHGATTGLETTETLAASPSATNWGAVFTDGACAAGKKCTLTLTTPTDGIGAASLIANDKIIITYASTHEVNPSSAGSKVITITTLTGVANAGSDSGVLAVPIVDSDQVGVSATVNSSITFDLDVGTTGAENTNAPYTVALGTLSISDAKVSGATDGINRIMMDLDTNASGGAIVTVKNANGANGLVSASSSDNINSATGTIGSAPIENYGLCVISVTQTTGSLVKASPYNTGSCAADSNTNDIQGLTTTPTDIVSTATAIAGGRAQIAVNALIDGVTSAHNDYADTLTFIATGRF